jgi:phospholipase C
VSETLNVLTSNPQVWSKTIFIVNYDENDGYFDHVPPFVAPEPGNALSGKTSAGIDAALEYLPLEQDLKRHAAREARGGPVGLGFRVPLLVVSPWSRGGYVCSQVFDHTSVLQLLEQVVSRQTGKTIRETNISAWRRTVCGDLSAAFRPFVADRSAPGISSRDAFFEQVHRAQFRRMPSGYRPLTARDAVSMDWMLRQEPGLRPSVALPYELAASGNLSADGKAFEIVLEARNGLFGKKASGAPFHVYTPGNFRGGSELRTRAYAVAAGNRLTDSWELAGFGNSGYHLRVCGPNGFFREFAGMADDPQVTVGCDFSPSEGFRIEAMNGTDRTVTLIIRDESYSRGTGSIELRAGEKQAVELGLAGSHDWYDFSVKLGGSATFLRRFAGRVERGKNGYSDPALGRA